MDKLRSSRRGDTIVEVVVSFALMMLFLAALAGAISFSGRAQQKAQALRAAAYQASSSLREANAVEGDTITYTFSGFSVTAKKTTTTAKDDSEQPYIFYRFAPQTGG